jgi:hypothetical protein
VITETMGRIVTASDTLTAACTTADSATVGARAPTNRAGERKRQLENERLREIAQAAADRQALEDARAASELGREIHQAIVARPNRAGERKRQAESKRKRQEAADRDEAAKRRRQICEAPAATTPAQLIMARMRERVAAREDAQTHTYDKG